MFRHRKNTRTNRPSWILNALTDSVLPVFTDKLGNTIHDYSFTSSQTAILQVGRRVHVLRLSTSLHFAE